MSDCPNASIDRVEVHLASRLANGRFADRSQHATQAGEPPQLSASIDRVEVHPTSRLARGRSTDQSRPAIRADESIMN